MGWEAFRNLLKNVVRLDVQRDFYGLTIFGGYKILQFEKKTHSYGVK